MKTVVLLALLASVAPVSAGQLGPDPSNPIYLQDRGTGVSTSMFGTYVRKGELIVYPFYEYYRDDALENKPEEYGAAGDFDYRGRYRAHEGLVFVSYGLSDNIAVEFEVAAISAAFKKSPMHPSTLH